MKFIEKIERSRGRTPFEIWLTQDNFSLALIRKNNSISITIRNDHGFCTECIYNRIIKINNSIDIKYGGIKPPAIIFDADKVDLIMNLIDTIDKSNIYYEDSK